MITLTAGWNLVAYPGVSAQPVDTALQSLADKCIRVYGFQEGNWVSYMPDRPAQENSLHTMEPGQSYWIQLADSATWYAN